MCKSGLIAVAENLIREQAIKLGIGEARTRYAQEIAAREINRGSTLVDAVVTALNRTKIKPRQPQDYDPFAWIDRPLRPFHAGRWAFALVLAWFTLVLSLLYWRW